MVFESNRKKGNESWALRDRKKGKWLIEVSGYYMTLLSSNPTRTSPHTGSSYTRKENEYVKNSPDHYAGPKICVWMDLAKRNGTWEFSGRQTKILFSIPCEALIKICNPLEGTSLINLGI